MVIIKRQKIKAYILLESLVSLAILTLITSLILGQLTLNQRMMQEQMKRQEALNVAIMAIQTKQSHLTLNEISVDMTVKSKAVMVWQDGKEIFNLYQE